MVIALAWVSGCRETPRILQPPVSGKPAWRQMKCLQGKSVNNILSKFHHSQDYCYLDLNKVPRRTLTHSLVSIRARRKNISHRKAHLIRCKSKAVQGQGLGMEMRCLEPLWFLCTIPAALPNFPVPRALPTVFSGLRWQLSWKEIYRKHLCYPDGH